MKKNILFSALALAILWLTWMLLYFLIGNDYVLPSFWETVAAMGRLFTDVSFWRAFGNTFLRTLEAFALAVVLGSLLAALACVSDGLRAFFAPIVSVLRTVPTMAIILLLLLWTSHAVAPVIVSLLVLFPAFYAAMLAALDEVRAEYGLVARAFRVSRGKKIFGLYFPLAAPSVLGQTGPILSMGLKITVSGEVLAQTYRSLGGMMQDAQLSLEIPRLLALTILVIVLGFVLEGLFALLGKLVVRWRA